MADEIIADMGGLRERRIPVDYPSNSKKSKEQKAAETPEGRKRPDKVVSGDVVKRKQASGTKIFRTFLSEDSGSVIEYIITEVLVPAAKNMIYDSLSQGAQRMLFGDSRPSATSGPRTAYTNYNRASTARPEARTMSRQAQATHDFSDLILADRGEAEDVLDGLRNMISQYSVATVSDLYDLVGLTGEFTDNKWGWYDLRSATVRLVRGGYLLVLPRTEPIT